MIKEPIAILCTVFLIATTASASTAIFEAGPFAIVLDQSLEKTTVATLDVYPTFWFKPITSREQVKENHYEFQLSTIYLDDPNHVGLINNPTYIQIQEKPLSGLETYAFTPHAVKNITIGRINPIDTTLYTGEWMNQTPYFVLFKGNGFYCSIYHQDTNEKSMRDLLNGTDVINKSDLGKYLPKLWSEEI